MHTITLIGDSIRMGYQPIVTDLLSGVADVWGPEGNGGNSANVLANFSPWLLGRPADVIHLNCGLHDLKTLVYDTRGSVIPLAHYRDNVATLLRTLRAHTRATLIWATTTPVIYQRAHAAHAGGRDFDRFAEDVTAYNTAATEVALDLGVRIDDLFAVVCRAGPARIIRPDGVHYTDEGRALLGAHVADVLADALFLPLPSRRS